MLLVLPSVLFSVPPFILFAQAVPRTRGAPADRLHPRPSKVVNLGVENTPLIFYPITPPRVLAVQQMGKRLRMLKDKVGCIYFFTPQKKTLLKQK